MPRFWARFILPVLLLPGAVAQTPRVEIGVQLSGLRESVLGECPLGGGGRVTVHAWRFLDAEVEVDRFPIRGGKALFPATLATAGARAGRRFGSMGVYGRLRPGLVRFDPNLYAPGLGSRAALDFGGVLEFYSRRHFAGRMDFGDVAVWYGHDVVIPAIANPGPGAIPGTRHQLVWTLGLSAWF